jgi:hypothetical protein
MGSVRRAARTDPGSHFARACYSNSTATLVFAEVELLRLGLLAAREDGLEELLELSPLVDESHSSVTVFPGLMPLPMIHGEPWRR